MSGIYNKIMLTLDGSDFSKKALPHAQELAKRYDAELILYRVVIDIGQIITMEYGYGGPPAFYNFDFTSEQAQLIEEATAKTREIADNLATHGIQTEAVIEVGRPATKILDYAARNNMDLIVMSTHGRSGLSRVVYGSVANQVLSEADCPVLLIRQITKGD